MDYIRHEEGRSGVGQAEDTAVGYRVAGIPTIAVAGRYTVTDDQKTILAASDELTTKARAETKKPKK